MIALTHEICWSIKFNSMQLIAIVFDNFIYIGAVRMLWISVQRKLE